jgi:hypothetical protein
MKKGEYNTAQTYLEEAAVIDPNSEELKNDLYFASKKTE